MLINRIWRRFTFARTGRQGSPVFWCFQLRGLGSFNRRHLHIKLNLASFGTDELVVFGDAGQGWEILYLFFMSYDSLNMRND